MSNEGIVMSDREAFEKLQKYIPPWIVFDEAKGSYKLAEQALNSEANHETLDSYNRAWWIFQSAIEHCKQGDCVAIYEQDTNHLQELQDDDMTKGWRWMRKDFARGDKLFAHAMPKSDDMQAANKEGQQVGANSMWQYMDKKLRYIHSHDIPWQPYDAWIKSIDAAMQELGMFKAQATPQPTTDISELVKELDSYLKGTLATPCNVSRRIKLRKLLDEVIAKHTVK